MTSFYLKTFKEVVVQKKKIQIQMENQKFKA